MEYTLKEWVMEALKKTAYFEDIVNPPKKLGLNELGHLVIFYKIQIYICKINLNYGHMPHNLGKIFRKNTKLSLIPLEVKVMKYPKLSYL